MPQQKMTVCVVCCHVVMLSVVKRVNICLLLLHTLMDYNQTWVIGATWQPTFVDGVKGHTLRSKVNLFCLFLQYLQQLHFTIASKDLQFLISGNHNTLLIIVSYTDVLTIDCYLLSYTAILLIQCNLCHYAHLIIFHRIQYFVPVFINNSHLYKCQLG